ncbi:MAG TPA: GNAT family N-acetyltransferase [Gemmataceae bacterium]|nr:GNAT family N-acetyltransferase [Gemmataceae bacterium]
MSEAALRDLTCPARALGPLRVRIHRDIDEIDPAEWDGLLADEELQLSHRFVRLCQRSRVEDADYWHLLVYQEDRLCGVASLSRMHVPLDVLSSGMTRCLIRSVRRRHPAFLRIGLLVCGLPVSFGQPCLKLAPWANAGAVSHVLAAVMGRIGRETKTHLLCLKEFDPVTAVPVDPVCRHGFFRVPSLPSCSLELRWDSFADYLREMTAGYRRQLRATLRTRDAAGLTFRRVESFAAEGDVIHALYGQVIERAQYRLETLNRAFIDRLDTDLGGQSRAIVLERHGRPLAVAVMLFAGTLATFLLAGIDYRADRQWQVYPNLVVAVVDEAIRSGASRLELGQTSYALKGRLGAVEVPRFLYLRHRQPLAHLLLRGSAGLLFPRHDYPSRRVFRGTA